MQGLKTTETKAFQPQSRYSIKKQRSSSNVSGYEKKSSKKKKVPADAQTLRYYAMLNQIKATGGKTPSDAFEKLMANPNFAREYKKSITDEQRKLCHLKRTAWNDFDCQVARIIGNLPLASLIGTSLWYDTIEQMRRANPNVSIGEVIARLVSLAEQKIPLQATEQKDYLQMYEDTAQNRLERIPKVWQNRSAPTSITDPGFRAFSYNPGTKTWFKHPPFKAEEYFATSTA